MIAAGHDRTTTAPHRPVRRVVARLAALCTITVAALGMITVGTPNVAGAYCLQFGAPSIITTNWGQQRANGHYGGADTCNLDGFYGGAVDDTLTDGSCVTAQFADPAFTFFNQGTSCGAPTSFGFYDQTGDTSAYIRIIKTGGTSQWEFSDQY